jgi:hypothetical protein
MEYGADRRFSFLRPGCASVAKDVQPRTAVFVVGWRMSFVCGGPGWEVGGRAPRIQNGGRTVLSIWGSTSVVRSRAQGVPGLWEWIRTLTGPEAYATGWMHRQWSMGKKSAHE